MNHIQLEHIVRAASQFSGDSEIIVIGSQAIHAQTKKLPPIAFRSEEADVYPRNYPERADDVDAAIGELSQFHKTHDYYAHGIGPHTAILPAGWEQRLIPIRSQNTGGATGCASTCMISCCRNPRRGVRATSSSTARLCGMAS